MTTAICPCPVEAIASPIEQKYPLMKIGQKFSWCEQSYQVISPITRTFLDLKGLWQKPLSIDEFNPQELESVAFFRRDNDVIFPTVDRLIHLLVFFASLKLGLNLKSVIAQMLYEMPHLSESSWVKGTKWNKTHKFHSYLIQPVKWTYQGYKPYGKVQQWTQRGQVFLFD